MLGASQSGPAIPEITWWFGGARANSSISAMRPSCYRFLEEMVTLGVIYARVRPYKAVHRGVVSADHDVKEHTERPYITP